MGSIESVPELVRRFITTDEAVATELADELARPYPKPCTPDELKWLVQRAARGRHTSPRGFLVRLIRSGDWRCELAYRDTEPEANGAGPAQHQGMQPHLDRANETENQRNQRIGCYVNSDRRPPEEVAALFPTLTVDEVRAIAEEDNRRAQAQAQAHRADMKRRYEQQSNLRLARLRRVASKASTGPNPRVEPPDAAQGQPGPPPAKDGDVPF